jgi:hypothetical protein
MKIGYVPLLRVMREVYTTPRGPARFDRYLRTVLNADRTDVELLPLLAANPMAKDHVTALLDALLALDADGIGARTAAEAAARLADEPGDYRATLVVADDLMGGWTNRYAYEFDFRVGYGPHGKRFWGPVGVLWSSEPACEGAVRETMAAAVYRTAYMRRHGPPRTLRDILAQERWVMAMADCAGPTLDTEDIEYTREVLVPYLDVADKRTVMECLFGDPAGTTLGFTPRGLTHWAGLALALHDGRTALAAEIRPVGARYAPP